MKKTLLFLFFVFATSCILSAQKKAGDSDSATKINKLEEENKRLQSQLKDSTKKISDLNKKLSSTQKEYDKYVEENESNKSKKAEIEVPYQQKITSLDSIIKSKDSQIESLEMIVAAISREKDSILNQISQWDKWKKMYIKDTLQKGRIYLERQYSKMDNDYIDRTMKLCKNLNDESLDKLVEDFRNAQINKSLYESLLNCLNTSYDENTINTCLEQYETQLKLPINAEQQAELDSTISLIKSYKSCQNTFFYVVKRVSGYMAGYRTADTEANVAKDAAEKIFEAQRIVEYVNTFSQIPYLQQLFEKYKEQLLNNPTETPEIEQKIVGNL